MRQNMTTRTHCFCSYKKSSIMTTARVFNYKYYHCMTVFNFEAPLFTCRLFSLWILCQLLENAFDSTINVKPNYSQIHYSTVVASKCAGYYWPVSHC